MERAGYYRELAARCVLMASDLKDPGHRTSLLEMAQRWRDLAEHVEQAEVADPEPYSSD
jgi:hypothetical protein